MRASAPNRSVGVSSQGTANVEDAKRAAPNAEPPAQRVNARPEEPVLGEAIIVEGRILWEDGAPSVGAVVGGMADGVWRCSTQSSAGGTFRLMCRGVKEITVVAVGLEDPSNRPRTLELPSEPFSIFLHPPRYVLRPEPWQGVVIEVPRQASISGQVIEPDGRPAIGARVIWTHDEGNDYLMRLDPSEVDSGVLTDTQGRFSLRNLKAGITGTLRAISPKHTPMRLQGIRSGSRGVVLRFPQGATVAGRVEAPGGTIPNHFTVELSARHQHERRGWRIATNLQRVPGARPRSSPIVSARRTVDSSTGQFIVTGVGPGRYDMEVHANDGRVGCVEDIEVIEGSDPTPIVVEIGKPALQGRVVDADTGQPLTGIPIGLSPWPGTPEVKTDPKGRFAFDFGTPGASTSLIVSSVNNEKYGFEEFLVRPSAGKQGDVGDLPLLRISQPRRHINISLQPSPEGPVVDGGAAAAAAGMVPGDRLVSISGRSVVRLGPDATERLLQTECDKGCEIETRKAGNGAVTRVQFRVGLKAR